jgi:pimeloyl-ACP methyl ester carboxylesterase
MAGAAVLAGGRGGWPLPIRSGSFAYRSSVDDTGPLYADVAWVPSRQPKPLVIVMHGYLGSRKSVAADLRELAAKGVFAVAPDMRGRGDSAGWWDSGGLDVHDILDAVLAAVRRYPGELDARNLNVVGYSGGGGNAIACAVRFPDLFRTCVSFFGISDYAWWHRSGGLPECNVRMERALGGPPGVRPELYAARDANAAAGNARSARLHFFWDEAERACPPGMIETFLENYWRAGLGNAEVHVSVRGDRDRWIHGDREHNPSLSDPADSRFLPDVLAAKPVAARLPLRGRLVVPGYLVTRRFAVWIGDPSSVAVQGQVIVEYDLTGKLPRVQVIENHAKQPVRIVLNTPLAALPA